MNTNELWQAVLGELELTLSKANFTTWFKNTFISNYEGEKVIISVPNTFTKTWLEKKYNAAILKSLQNITAAKIREIIYKVDFRSASKPMPPQEYGIPTGADAVQTMTREETVTTIRKEAAPLTEGKTNPKHTFESYIVGKGNELAHAAAIAVADNLGTKYNPLFIYGGVGLGKTHLIQAIGNETLRRHPEAKVLYVSCERFTSEFINAIRSGRGKEFKDTYRTLDLLIIDDIQFLAAKAETQEEFFHTFNTLHESNKQVVLTSDRPPKLIPALEHRLISRFEMGLMADISSPDLETRIAIIDAKCKERNYDIDPEITRYIATIVQSNIRELEGVLNKIVAFHQFKNTKPTLESAKSILSNFGPSQAKKNVNARHLIQTVCQYFDVTMADMTGKCREKRLAFPRQIIMYLMREEMNSSYPTIGAELGGRDHTTAMHAYDKISREIEGSPKLRQDVDLIKQRLYNT
jgi:chromosomal replication initiator protein